MAQIYAIGNQKGGVGKTTTAVALANALAERGRRVLLVDLDPQASASISLGVEAKPGRSMAEVMSGQAHLAAGVIVELRPGLSLAPSAIELSESELVLVGRIGREYALKKALAPVTRRFDYILVDCPPSLSLLTVNALAAADKVLVPAIPQPLDTRGLAIFRKTMDLVKAEINPSLQLFGVLPTLVTQTKLHAKILEEWESNLHLPVLPLRVKRTIRAAEAPETGKPIAKLSPELGEIYKQLAEMIDDGKD
jgi:chromosome partitioning protein